MALTAKNMPYQAVPSGLSRREIYRVPMSYPFRDGPHGGAEVAAWAISKMDKEIGGSNIAAIIIEPIQGEGGFIVPAPGYLTALRDYATQHGIVFVADEIQTGFCRTGPVVRLRARRCRARPDHHGQGHRRWVTSRAVTGRARDHGMRSMSAVSVAPTVAIRSPALPPWARSMR